MSFILQDWKSVVLRKDNLVNKPQVAHDKETGKKVDAGLNKQSVTIASVTKKLDANVETFYTAHISIDDKKLIQKRRLELKLTQKELAAKLSMQQAIINKLENINDKTFVPTQQMVSGINKVLGTKIRIIKPKNVVSQD